jgi:hypothetical protein
VPALAARRVARARLSLPENVGLALFD